MGHKKEDIFKHDLADETQYRKNHASIVPKPKNVTKEIDTLVIIELMKKCCSDMKQAE